MRASRRILAVVLLLFAGFVLLPITTYIAGGRIVGRYSGTRGLASYLGTIYSDAAAGGPLALAVLLGPLLGVAVWWTRSWVLRHFVQGE